MSDQFDWRHTPFLINPDSYNYNFQNDNNFLNQIENEYFIHKPLVDQLTRNKKIRDDTEREPSPSFGDVDFGGCTKQLLEYIWDLLKYAIFDTPVPPDAKPDGWKCWTAGIFGVALIALIIITVAVIAGPAIIGGLTFLGPIASVFESIISQLETFINFMAEYTAIVLYYVKSGWNFLIENGKKLSDLIADVTGAYTPLVLLNFFTAVAWGLLQIALEFYEIELEWKNSDFYDIFEFFNTPITWILDLIKGASSDTPILYYIAKFFAVPFEVGTLLISLLVGGVWELMKELVAILKDHFKSNKSTNID